MKKESELLKISVSAAKTYEQCPRKYFFQYIEKVKVDKVYPHLELGNFVHAVLEQFHILAVDKEANEWPSLMSQICNAEKVNHKLTPANHVAARKMLTSYLALLKEDGMPPVLANEQGFNIKIEEENLLIRGFIDRIDRDENGNYHLIDYKSGKSRYLDDFQLCIYGLYLLEQYPDLERFKGSYIALAENSKFLSYTFTRTDVERALAKIKKTAQSIREDQTWDPKPGFLCSYCDFEDICPAMKKKSDDWAAKSTHTNENV